MSFKWNQEKFDIRRDNGETSSQGTREGRKREGERKEKGREEEKRKSRQNSLKRSKICEKTKATV